MYRDERSLVKRLKDKPFVLLGINSDSNREMLREVVAKENITWRSWMDGSRNGPIARAWQIPGWPTMIVLDADGVIRAREFDPDLLSGIVDKLLKEMEAAGKF